MNNYPALEIHNLTKMYYDNGSSECTLNDINLTIETGEFVCILGPSGCGKTTMLRCIAGFESYVGDIKVRGSKVSKPGTDRMMVFQDFNQLFPWRTVESNIQYPLRIQGIKDTAELKKISDASLKKVNLDGIQKYYPHQLSGGMKQRVAIAKAFAMNPKIILMDEPFAALDAITRDKLQQELLDIAMSEGSTIIFVTHNIQEALTLGSRILVFSKDGKIKLDKQNPLKRPVTPKSEGYSQAWEEFAQELNDI